MIKISIIEKVTYKSRLTKREVLMKLDENIEKQKFFSFGIDTNADLKPYVGKIESNKFKVKRNTYYRNDTLPRIKGEILDDFDGVKIKANISPEIIVLIFLTIWTIAITLGFLASIYGVITEGRNPIFLAPFAFFIFIIVHFLRFFKKENNKVIQDFKEILNAEIT